MFGFFNNREVDRNKVISFVEWFRANEAIIRKSVEDREIDHNEMLRVLDEVEAQLAKVYRDGYKGNIEFNYGGKDQDWEINLYHLNNQFLIDATRLIKKEFIDANIHLWRINIGR